MKLNEEIKILVVDDDMMNYRRAEFVLRRKGYQVEKAFSGTEALLLLETVSVDLILLDIYMPGMDGFEVLKQLKAQESTRDIPVILLTGETSAESEVEGFRGGAVDFIVKPFIEDIVLQRVSRTLELSQLQKELNQRNMSLEQEVELKTRNLQAMHDKMVMGMAEMVEGRDPNTGGHIKRTSDVVGIFVKKLRTIYPEFPASFFTCVTKAAPLHDIGKITIDDQILRKPGRFTEEEYSMMKRHSEQGATILARIIEKNDNAEFYRIAINIAHFHHEKYDGTGYPEHIGGNNIPFEARIMALADVFDALVSKRCYKEAYSYEQAFQIVRDSAGSHFDPVLAEHFLECADELMEYYDAQAGYNGFIDEYDFDSKLSDHVISPQEFDDLVQSLISGSHYTGVYHSEFQEFQRIFAYVKNLGERNKQAIQLLLMTMKDTSDEQQLEMGMKHLESAIGGALRRVDISIRVSRSQFAVLLVNLEDANVDMVVGRIEGMFQALVSGHHFEISSIVYRV